jgi:hypothetical protein
VNNSSCIKELGKAMRGQPVADWDLKLIFPNARLSLCKIVVFKAVTMKNGVFWDVMPCSYKNYTV